MIVWSNEIRCVQLRPNSNANSSLATLWALRYHNGSSISLIHLCPFFFSINSRLFYQFLWRINLGFFMSLQLISFFHSSDCFFIKFSGFFRICNFILIVDIIFQWLIPIWMLLHENRPNDFKWFNCWHHIQLRNSLFQGSVIHAHQTYSMVA